MKPCNFWVIGALALQTAMSVTAQFTFGQQPIGQGGRAPPNPSGGGGQGGGGQSQRLTQQAQGQGGQQGQQEQPPFDLDRDVAPILVSQMMGDAVRAAVSPFASDASLVIRYMGLLKSGRA